MLTLLLLACVGATTVGGDTGKSSVVDETPGEETPDDQDGDGFLARVDCDDAEASVHPGADEVWYDGVDQDCDGADDDQDGDGYALADDCDDTDPATNPGGGEVPNDGIDQDCDGVDLTSSGGDTSGGDTSGGEIDIDGDGDGWASEAFGGPDCDDTDAAVGPDAVEAVGDDVDSDCDGADYGVSGLRAGDLVLTEIMYDPDAVGDDRGEWFELYNATGHTVNLLDLVVSDDVAYGSVDLFSVDADLLAAPGERLVFGVSDDRTLNGGITVDFDYSGSGVNFNNSGDDIYVGVESGGRVTTIDSVTYNELSGWPIAKGVSIELNDTKVNTSDNGTASNWCRATSVAGTTTDRGSPGAVSSGC